MAFELVLQFSKPLGYCVLAATSASAGVQQFSFSTNEKK